MLNLVILTGNLGADPELSYTTEGTAKAIMRVATVEVWYTNGEKKEKTTWHRIVAWGRKAEIAGQYLTKGSLIGIEGSIDNRSWKDKEGNTRYTSEVKARDIKFYNIKARDGEVEEEAPVKEPVADAEPDDDIPF